MIQRRLLKHISALTLLLGMTLATGCNNEIETPAPFPGVPEGNVPVKLNLSGAYPMLSTRAEDNVNLQNKKPELLRDGSTVRLVILTDKPTGNAVKAEDVYQNQDMVYIIRRNNTTQELYPVPCKVDPETGEYIEGSETNVPYYLPIAYGKLEYYGMAISPARKLKEDDDGYLKLAVRNQEEVLVSDNNWNQTTYTPFTVPTSVDKYAEIHLNPLVHTSAKIQIIVKNGLHVTELTSAYPFAEIDRVPTNPGKSWFGEAEDNNNEHRMPDYNLVFGENIEEQMGNNILYNRMYLKYADKNDTTYYKDGKKIKEVTLTGETTVLPMDARPTPVIIRMDIDVNLTPMQYQFQVMEQFKAGHVYTYIVTISMKENDTYVATWQNAQWNEDLYPIN